MKASSLLLSAVLAIFAGCALINPGILINDVPRIEQKELADALHDPLLTVLDVRIGQDWGESTMKIKGALRVVPAEYATWIPKLAKDRRYVLYCT